MKERLNANRACPSCDSRDYQFRGRRQIEANGEEAGSVETKYRCKACGHEWRERVRVSG